MPYTIAEFVRLPFAEISRLLCQHRAELVPVELPYIKDGQSMVTDHTYLIKFDAKTDSMHPEINHLRGLIFNHQTSHVYSVTFPVPRDFKHTDGAGNADADAEIQGLETHNITRIQEIMDGTLMRLWYFPEGQRWILSTNSVVEADDANWQNEWSFGQLFRSVWGGNLRFPLDDQDHARDQDHALGHLNPNYTYLFWLCHPLNQIVVMHTKPKIYHVATYDVSGPQGGRDAMGISQGDINPVEIALEASEIGVARPPTVSLFEGEVDSLGFKGDAKNPPSPNQILATLVRRTHEMTETGIAGYLVTLSPDANTPSQPGLVHRLRIESKWYTRARTLRGNESGSGIYLTLMTHMTSGHPEDLTDFLTYFPQYIPHNQQLVLLMDQVTSFLLQVYDRRYRQHQYVTVSPIHHAILKKFHAESPKIVNQVVLQQFLKKQSLETVFKTIFPSQNTK